MEGTRNLSLSLTSNWKEKKIEIEYNKSQMVESFSSELIVFCTI